MAISGAERNAFEIVDRLNKAIRDEINNGDGFDMSDLVTLNDDGYALPVDQLLGSLMDNPEAISENLRNSLSAALNDAVLSGDTETMAGLMNVADLINFDPEELKANIQSSLAMAMAVGDDEGVDALLGVAVGLDIDLDMGFLDQIRADIEAQAIAATVKANINVQANVSGKTVDSIANSGSTVSGGASIPMFHDGGIYRNPMGEGLALLRDGERVLTPEQTAAYDSGRGSGGTTIINYSSFGETPYNAMRKIQRASSDAGM